jgi:hypothetical protein
MRREPVLILPALAVIAASASSIIAPLSAQEAGGSAAGPAVESGQFLLQGGPLQGIVARTQTNASRIQKSITWVFLPGASVSWTVPPGQSALFNVSFSTECSTSAAEGTDWVRVRVLDNGNPIEPYDGFQDFCSFPGTYTGRWAKRVPAGSHTIQVQFFYVDSPPTGNTYARIDDWKLKLQVYQ